MVQQQRDDRTPREEQPSRHGWPGDLWAEEALRADPEGQRQLAALDTQMADHVDLTDSEPPPRPGLLARGLRWLDEQLARLIEIRWPLPPAPAAVPCWREELLHMHLARKGD